MKFKIFLPNMIQGFSTIFSECIIILAITFRAIIQIDQPFVYGEYTAPTSVWERGIYDVQLFQLVIYTVPL
jgi:hypothetical protein